ncbi:low temperature requirement protein A [Actinacidiphila glaucinigra]|uniref:low temperature requirement protein A n=1 Tax=Actinacidiphila glaucinigra TaxID=235986 RepID=UPI000B788D53|nr:low temperature requirement protein A [Actinacidiphila glaucinigra]
MSAPQTAGTAWRRRMVARVADEKHRTATALELFFDLCFVVAVAQTSAAFEEELAAGHVGGGVLGYALVFFAIWWAWMNFTWFASAYDTDDIPYRLLTVVQIGGALVMSAGTAAALQDGDYTVITWGYVVMRLAMVSQWLRAARSDPERRQSCLRYAAGILVVQTGWLAHLVVPGDLRLPAHAVLALAELAVPVWAERAANTTWHPRHIAERFGLFTLIVLGESITAAAGAVRAALDTDATFGDIATLVLGGTLTVCALWWLYFAQNASRRLGNFTTATLWGYGHYAVFACAAAVGAGLAVNVAQATGHGHLTAYGAAAAYTVPVAGFVLSVWLLHRTAAAGHPTAPDVVHALAVAAILAATFAPAPVLVTGVVAALLVAATCVPRERGGIRAAAA